MIEGLDVPALCCSEKPGFVIAWQIDGAPRRILRPRFSLQCLHLVMLECLDVLALQMSTQKLCQPGLQPSAYRRRATQQARVCSQYVGTAKTKRTLVQWHISAKHALHISRLLAHQQQ